MPQREKDRESGMLNSSLHATAKKDGAGGKYTWGSPMDDPVGSGFETVMDQKDPNYVVGEPVNQKTDEDDKGTNGVVDRPTPGGPPAKDQENFPELGGLSGGHSRKPQGAWAEKH